MRAVMMREFGPPDVLELVEVDRPVPVEGEILVRVEAAGEALLDVVAAVGEGEGEFLRGGGAGFADVVAADRDRMSERHLA